MSQIDITGLDEVLLLHCLWIAVSDQVAICYGGTQLSFSDKLAIEAVKSYIDYFQGRTIKTDLSEDEVDPYLYDKNAGQGEFQRCVDSLKINKQT